jgi:hypothetical protein
MLHCASAMARWSRLSDRSTKMTGSGGGLQSIRYFETLKFQFSVILVCSVVLLQAGDVLNEENCVTTAKISQ